MSAERIEKMETHIKGLNAQVQAQKDMLAEMTANTTVMRTNHILISQAYKEVQDKLNAKHSEVDRLQNTIAGLTNPILPNTEETIAE